MVYLFGLTSERGKFIEVSALPDESALRLRAEFTTYTGMTNFFVVEDGEGKIYCVKKTNDLPPGTDYLGKSVVKDEKGERWGLIPMEWEFSKEKEPEPSSTPLSPPNAFPRY